ncbi:hypothetical protein V8G54_025909, partial [Vigna mungo]
FKVVEIVFRYESTCIPNNVTDKVAYIQSSASKACSITLHVNLLRTCLSISFNSNLSIKSVPMIYNKRRSHRGQSFLFLKQFSFEKVHKHMKSPIHVYYQLDNFYQNHRRYVTTLAFMLQTFISTVSNPHLQSEGKRSFYETRISWFFLHQFSQIFIGWGTIQKLMLVLRLFTMLLL